MNTRQLQRAKSVLSVWSEPGTIIGGLRVLEPFGDSLHRGLTSYVGNTYRLAARWGNLTATPKTKVVSFALHGARGRRPLFDHQQWGSGAVPAFPEPQTPRWSYNKRDWTAFDNIAATPTTISFSHNAPFVENTVFVSVYPPSRLALYRDWLAREVIPHPAIHATASELSAGSRTVAMTPARTVVDDTVGATRPAQPCLGLRFQWPGSSPTKLGVVTGGEHAAGENHGRWKLAGFVKYLLESTDPEAAVLRNNWTFLFYPQLNPLGDAVGSSRGWGEDTTIDPNRQWNVPGTTFHQALKASITADMQAVGLGNPRYTNDLHTTATYENYIIIPNEPGSPGAAYFAAFAALEPGVIVDNAEASIAGTFVWWWAQTGTLRPALVPCTHENSTEVTETDGERIGGNLAKALGQTDDEF